MAKVLTDRKEIAKALNFGKYPVLTVDMTNHGGFDDTNYCIGCNVKCEYESSYGTMYTQGKIYIEGGEIKISNNAVCLRSYFGYSSIKDMVLWANAPVVKADQDIVIVWDFKDINNCIVEMAHTGKKVDPNCQVALTIERID